MPKKRYTAEEAAEFLTADSDLDGDDLESSSEDDLSSIGKDENQPILSNSDSDDIEARLTSSGSESEDDSELNDSIATDNYYKTRDDYYHYYYFFYSHQKEVFSKSYLQK